MSSSSGLFECKSPSSPNLVGRKFSSPTRFPSSSNLPRRKFSSPTRFPSSPNLPRRKSVSSPNLVRRKSLSPTRSLSPQREVRIILPPLKDCELKEVSTIRHPEEIKYMPYEDFKVKFPRSKVNLGIGTNSEVYESGEYVVKVFCDVINEKEFCIELNAYSSLAHPCIIRPAAWSIHERRGYIAMDKGTSIHLAYGDKTITIEQIISDILSAVAFLNINGYAHGDIKPNNMVYHNGMAKLIDMGLFKKAKLDIDGDYYITGPSYTSVYKDPEYVAQQYNKIKCEIYSIAISCIEILNGVVPEFGRLHNYVLGDTPVGWFLNEAKKLLIDRKNISCLIQQAPSNLIDRTHKGTIFAIPPLSEGRKCDKKATLLMSWLIAVAYRNDFDMEALFLALHLIRRTFDKVIQRHADNVKSILMVFGCVVMHIVLSIISSPTLDISDWQRESNSQKDDRFEDKFNKMFIEIFDISKGIISTLTSWDYAQSQEDLAQLLHDTVNCNYDPELIRQVGGNSNKCITVRKALTKEDLKLYQADAESLPLPSKFSRGLVLPCHLNLDPDLKVVEYEWNIRTEMYSENISTLFPVLLHNRLALCYLKYKLATRIFLELVRLEKEIAIYRRLINVLLVSICGSNWKLQIEDVLAKGGNPFMAYIEMNRV